MPVMETLKFTLPTSVRANPGVKKRLKIRLLQMEEVTPLRFDGQDELTMEAVTNTLWHYFATLDDAQAAAFLSREFPRLEAFMRGEAAPPTRLHNVSDQVHDADAPPRKKPRHGAG